MGIQDSRKCTICDRNIYSNERTALEATVEIKDIVLYGKKLTGKICVCSECGD